MFGQHSTCTLIALVLSTAFIGLTGTVNGQTRQDYTYDEAGRVSTVTVTSGNTSRVISYGYDKRSNLTSVQTEVTVGVDDADDAVSFTVRPNPATDHFVIEIPTAGYGSAMVELSTTSGRQVVQRSVSALDGGIAKLDLDTQELGLASGTYIVTITLGERRVSSAVVISR